MPWNLLILPLAGGYYILTRCIHFKYVQQRLDTQRLIFESVLLGIGLLILTYIIRLFFSFCCPDLFYQIHSYSPFSQQYFLTSLLSIAIAVTISHGYNLINNNHKKISEAIVRVGNEFERLMHQSFTEASLLLFTLNNGKIYIGWVKELPIPSISAYVRIIPAISGYRNVSGEVEFTTQYLKVYSTYITEGKIQGIEELNTDIILDISDIVSVSNFDPEMFNRFQEQHKE